MFVLVFFSSIVGFSLTMGLFLQIGINVANILLCIVLGIASVGVYSFNYDSFDLFLALVFGALGYAFRKFDIPKAPLLLQ